MFGPINNGGPNTVARNIRIRRHPIWVPLVIITSLAPPSKRNTNTAWILATSGDITFPASIPKASFSLVDADVMSRVMNEHVLELSTDQGNLAINFKMMATRRSYIYARAKTRKIKSQEEL
jgi:hypothetical protein